MGGLTNNATRSARAAEARALGLRADVVVGPPNARSVSSSDCDLGGCASLWSVSFGLFSVPPMSTWIVERGGACELDLVFASRLQRRIQVRRADEGRRTARDRESLAEERVVAALRADCTRERERRVRRRGSRSDSR